MADDDEKETQAEFSEAEMQAEIKALADADDSPFDPEALKKVIMALGNSAEAMAAERAADEEAAAFPNYEADMALDAQASPFEKALASSREPGEGLPDYTEDMKLDAKGIAEILSKQLGMPVSAMNLHTGEMGKADVPKPTLESLHAQLLAVDASFVTNLTALRKDRIKGRENAVQAGMIEYLHSGKIDKMRAFATGSKRWPHAAGLSDELLTTLMGSQLQDHGLTAVALGIYVGALLTRSGFSMSEAIECANDPVFGLLTLAMKVTPATVTEHALEVISDVHQRRVARGQPSS